MTEHYQIHQINSLLETEFNQTNPNANSTLNSTLCSDWLLNLQLVPRDREIPNQCPDAISVPILAGGIFSIYISLVSISILGFIWKRKSAHIQARSTAGMWFTVFSSMSVATVYSLRYAIGRHLFPCLVYSYMFFMIPASFTVPTILRSLRIYVQWRVNWFKARHFKENELKKNELLMSTDLMVRSLSPPPSPLGGGDGEGGNSPLSLIPTTNPTNQNKWKKLKEYLTLFKNVERKEQYYIMANSVFHSKKWSFFIFMIVFGIQGFLWFVFDIVEESFYPESRIFFQEASMVSLRGCYALLPTTINISIQFGAYFVIEFLCLIWLFLTEKDAYFIKVETIITMVFQLTTAIIYASCTMDFYRLIDKVFPSGLIMVLYCTIEIVITVTLPVIYSIVKDCRKVEVFENELEWVLNKNETCEILLEYSRRSFCPEGVLVYKDITKFKLETNFKRRKLIALEILDCYLTPGGVYELNIPNINSLREEANLKINSVMFGDELSDDLFEKVLVQNLLTLRDVYDRLRTYNEKMRKLSKEWRERENREKQASPRTQPLLNDASLFV